MALNVKARGWLGAAPQSEVAELKDNLAKLAMEVSTLRVGAEEEAAQRQRDIEELRNEIGVIAQRLEAHAGQAFASVDELANLQQRIDRDGGLAEQLRIAIVGLGEQLRWESEDLRKGLAAIVERLEHQRRL